MPGPQNTSLPARVLLVGAGRVGTAVTALLARGGAEVAGVASRTAASATKAANFLDAPIVDLSALPAADLVVIGGVDQAISLLAEKVVSSPSASARVVHLSGASGTEPLRAVVEAGGTAWALHPVQACPDVQVAIERLPGSAWGVTVSDGLTDAMELVRRLGGVPFEVEEAARPLWHAASVMTSNGISALLAFGEEILESIGIESPDQVLGPLATGSITNARAGGGGAQTLTGPVVRGEASTVRKHLDALQGAPELQARYRNAARMILAAADSSGRMDPSARRAIEELL